MMDQKLDQYLATILFGEYLSQHASLPYYSDSVTNVLTGSVFSTYSIQDFAKQCVEHVYCDRGQNMTLLNI